ncbi:SgcJ/EcaC family oxidoreductase [Ensifer sp. LCM 4579]|uniref:SgcJ/EcaC family oxidoreductase n=1 Tax=Ensifer sp. LCM 4579 TaxID=1848292 RepID=UPI0008DAE0A6|nr:SgcJ/EcaC family oxidoreductase [Ensifer sp. LCM 4579]OHV77947.1 hypothetical protein LCM4579_06235 [Ensifer sp. LCM 4579]
MNETSIVPIGSQTAVSKSDAEAIRCLLGELVRAWDTGDGTAYGQAFSEDCDYVTFNGDRLCGREAVIRSHQALFDTHLKGSRLIFEKTDLRGLRDDTVLVHCVGNSVLKGQTSAPKARRSIQTMVAVRNQDGWHFTAFHNTRIFKITGFRALLMMFGL